MSAMLSSWKEIAHFFGKGVRTVQRWEKTLDLPIRRPPGAPSNVVLARTSDLEEWMHRGRAGSNVAHGITVVSSTEHKKQDAAQDGEINVALSELEDALQLLLGAAPTAGASELHPRHSDPVQRIHLLKEAVADASTAETKDRLRAA